MTAPDVPPVVQPALRQGRRPGSARSGRRRAAWVLLLTMAGALFGLGLSAQLHPSYLAEGSLLVRPMVGNAFGSVGGNRLTDLETESQVVTSDAVLRRVVTAAGGQPTVEAIRARLGVDVVPNAEVLLIRYRGSSPAIARDMVQRIAEATLQERIARADAANAQQREVIAELRKQATGEFPDDPSGAQQLIWTQRTASLTEQEAAASVPMDRPGRLMTVVPRGDGHSRLLQLLLVVGCAAFGGAVGYWVGGAPSRRSHPHPDRA